MVPETPTDRAGQSKTYGGKTLDELQAMEGAGTPRNVEYDDGSTAIYAGDKILAHICTDYIDGELFAVARNALPDLLSSLASLGAALDAAEAERDQLRAGVNECKERYREELHRAARFENDAEHLLNALESVLADCAAIGVEPFSAAAARALLGRAALGGDEG